MARKNNEFRNGYYPNEHEKRRRPARRRSRRAFPVPYLVAGVAAVVLIAAGIVFIPRIIGTGATPWSTADVAGSWAASSNGKQAFTATIADNTITINWASDDLSALYWKGTFVVPEGNESTKTVISDAAEENATALFASSDAQKTFTVTKSSIEFEASAMGATAKFTLKR